MAAQKRQPLGIAVIGTGVIGKEHANRIEQNPRSQVAAVVDPSPAAAAWAAERSLPFYGSTAAMLSAHRPHGAIVATPTEDHATTAIALLEAGVPVLVEKPLAGGLSEAAKLVRAVERLGTPILTGYHRRHSPLIQAAAKYAAAGHLGRMVSIAGSSLFYKPSEYFETGWRTGPGGGPILINLAHEIDSLRALAGEISSVQAIASSRVRRNEVEDTAAVLLEFESGAVGTLAVSDCAVSPFSWEQTSGENPIYAHESSQDSLVLAGTHGSLALPSLRWWRQEGQRSWALPFTTGTIRVEPGDPLARQLNHFLDVAERRAEPIVSAHEGFRSLAAILAVREAVVSGGRVIPGTLSSF